MHFLHEIQNIGFLTSGICQIWLQSIWIADQAAWKHLWTNFCCGFQMSRHNPRIISFAAVLSVFLQKKANKQAGLVVRHSPNCQWVIEVKCQCPAGEEERWGETDEAWERICLCLSPFLSYSSLFLSSPPFLLSSRNGHCRCYILAVASHNSENFNSNFPSKTCSCSNSIYVNTKLWNSWKKCKAKSNCA